MAPRFDIGEVGRKLGAQWSTTPNHRTPSTWDDVLRIDAGRRIVGEIRKPEDWDSFPVQTKVRAVYYTDAKGPHIRWGRTGSLANIFPNDIHDWFYCKGDEVQFWQPLNGHQLYTAPNAREGFITVSSTGEIKIE